MERIIGSYAVKSFSSSQEYYCCEMSDIQKGSVYGAIEPLATNIGGETDKLTDCATNQLPQFHRQHQYSESLQTLLEQKPSVWVYLLLISSTLFLSTLIILVWGMMIIDASNVLGLKADKISAKYTLSFAHQSEIKNLQFNILLSFSLFTGAN